MDDKLIPTLVLPGDEEEAQQAAAEAEAPVQEAAQPGSGCRGCRADRARRRGSAGPCSGGKEG